jgi:hypothetical protein
VVVVVVVVVVGELKVGGAKVFLVYVSELQSGKCISVASREICGDEGERSEPGN